MTTPFDGTQSAVEQQKKALLDSIAQAGTAGRRAYEQEQDRLAAQRQAAAQATLQDAARRGAPQALGDQLAQQVATPYDRQISTLGQAAASRDADLAQRRGATEAYLGQVQGAIPIVRSTADREVQQIKAEATERAAQRAHEAQMRAMETRLAELRLRQAEEDDAEAMTPGKILSALGGVDAAVPFLREAGAAHIGGKAAHAEELSRGPNGPGGGHSAAQRNYASRLRSMTPEQQADELGQEIGLPPGYAGSLVKDRDEEPTSKTEKSLGMSKVEIDKVKKGTSYKRAQEAVKVGLDSGWSLNELKRALNGDPGIVNPKAVALILEENRHRFPTNEPDDF